MSQPSNLDTIRRAALDSAEQSRRLWTRVLALFALVEAACWLAYVALAIYQFPTSVLVGVAALLVYSTVFTSIMGLRLHLDNCTRGILKAIETLASERPTD
jgi:hypothetical protein